MFVWAKFPPEQSGGKGSIEYAMDLLNHANVAIAPGRAFGENGEFCMRIALVENENRLRQAIRNISRFNQSKPVGGKKRGTAKTSE
jgi:alanine-synthesizing transaminase